MLREELLRVKNCHKISRYNKVLSDYEQRLKIRKTKFLKQHTNKNTESF